MCDQFTLDFSEPSPSTPKKRAYRRDLIGQVFGRLTVLEEVASVKEGRLTKRRWLCRCICGRTCEVRQAPLTDGRTGSCGKDACHPRMKHGMVNSPEYQSWENMLARCSNPHSPAYPDYGGRGITVCERWKNFANFLADMGTKPSSRHSIGRINNDSGYEPLNCQWEDCLQQANNTRSNRWIEYDGERLTMAQWSRKTGLSQKCIQARLAKGWTVEFTLTTPADVHATRRLRGTTGMKMIEFNGETRTMM